MRTIARILGRDLKRLVSSPVALVVAVGVCLVPALYAWVNILANWDPYQNTSTVPVAVVVEDKGAEVPGMGEVNAGDMVRERLEENHQLGWTFVDQDEALEGVRAGRYYAAFVIPPDFTSTLAGVLDGHPTQGPHWLLRQREGQRGGAQGDGHGGDHARGPDRRAVCVARR